MTLVLGRVESKLAQCLSLRFIRPERRQASVAPKKLKMVSFGKFLSCLNWNSNFLDFFFKFPAFFQSSIMYSSISICISKTYCWLNFWVDASVFWGMTRVFCFLMCEIWSFFIHINNLFCVEVLGVPTSGYGYVAINSFTISFLRDGVEN